MPTSEPIVPELPVDIYVPEIIFHTIPPIRTDVAASSYFQVLAKYKYNETIQENRDKK